MPQEDIFISGAQMLEDLAITRNGIPVATFSSPTASTSASQNGTISSQVTSPTPSYAAVHSDGHQVSHDTRLDPTTTPWVPGQGHGHGHVHEAQIVGHSIGQVLEQSNAALGTEKEPPVPPVPHNTPQIPYSLYQNSTAQHHANPHTNPHTTPPSNGSGGQPGQLGSTAGAA
jgi:hypothetical protein